MVKSILIFGLIAVIFYGCSSDSPVTTENNNPSDYTKIYTAVSGSNKFEVYSLTSTDFVYGYNDIGFKFFLNNAEQTSGFVKFKSTMYHGLGGPSHSVPASEKFYYDGGKHLFTGYSIFIMYDTAAFWTSDFNYNDEAFIDSSSINLVYSSKAQVYAWDNTVLEHTYILTMIEPSIPHVGLNDVDLMLHQTSNMTDYLEVNNAEMFIKPWMEAMGHGSSNNTNPSMVSPGRYKGSANFNMAGEWFLYDSIKVDGTFITRTPAPKFILQVN
ncbi:MAG: FixH family protein [Ignavibacteria bacterium]